MGTEKKNYMYGILVYYTMMVYTLIWYTNYLTHEKFHINTNIENHNQNHVEEDYRPFTRQ